MRHRHCQTILTDNGYIENGIYYFYIKDHLGNNRVVANASGAMIQATHYYPFGSSFAVGTGANAQPYKYNGKELDEMHGLNQYDYSARQYEPTYGRFTSVDPLTEKYYSWSPYAYVANNPMNAIDPTGKLVIFINGMHDDGSGGSPKYWKGDHGDFVNKVMAHLGDYRAYYFDGSLGGLKGLPNNLSPNVRFKGGYTAGKRYAAEIINNLKKNETIKIITHSMGAAYGKGLLYALLQYCLEHDIDPSILEFEADFAPFQTGQQKAVEGVPTLQFSHSDDDIAKNKPVDGAEQRDTSSDKDQGHPIDSFYDQIKNLPEGTYIYKNGKFIPK